MDPQMSSNSKPGPYKPRLIIHGGAGNITTTNLPPSAYHAYRNALLSILHSTQQLSSKNASAVDAAVHAVSQSENNPLFNAGHGAVFTTAGTHELECSLMVSHGYRKRGVGSMKLSRVKNPIAVAREMLIRGEDVEGGGARGHVQLEGETVEGLAREWGCEMCWPSWCWTKKRWDEHRRGLGLGTDWETYERERRKADEGDGPGGDGESVSGIDERVGGIDERENLGKYDDPSWNGTEYLPQGTVGCVVMDSWGTLCVATSTGGLTNKLPGRIGDTPTLGAGFWAEQWVDEDPFQRHPSLHPFSATTPLASILRSSTDCMSTSTGYVPLPQDIEDESSNTPSRTHAVAMSGTGNGDSFLKLSAARTAAAMTRFAYPPLPLSVSVTRMAGPKGMLQQSAGDRWHKTGEGEGGIIGIEIRAGRGDSVADFNCGGMFRAWVDERGEERMMVFRKEYDEVCRDVEYKT